MSNVEMAGAYFVEQFSLEASRAQAEGRIDHEVGVFVLPFLISSLVDAVDDFEVRGALWIPPESSQDRGNLEHWRFSPELSAIVDELGISAPGPYMRCTLYHNVKNTPPLLVAYHDSVIAQTDSLKKQTEEDYGVVFKRPGLWGRRLRD